MKSSRSVIKLHWLHSCFVYPFKQTDSLVWELIELRWLRGMCLVGSVSADHAVFCVSLFPVWLSCCLSHSSCPVYSCFFPALFLSPVACLSFSLSLIFISVTLSLIWSWFVGQYLNFRVCFASTNFKSCILS